MFGENDDKYIGSETGSGLHGPCNDEGWPHTNGDGWKHGKLEDGEKSWMNVTIGDLIIENFHEEVSND